ncbi:MAG: leucine-rich repeat protein [Methanomassiliicoccaceae archaeon]|nr:leucine-rich repeat protein [Methanomassiliicoccaceae archaeon]
MRTEKETITANTGGRRRTTVFAVAAALILSAAALLVFASSEPQGNDSENENDQKLGYTGTGETFEDWDGREYEIISLPPEGTAALIDNHGHEEIFVSIWGAYAEAGPYMGEFFTLVAIGDGAFAGDEWLDSIMFPYVTEIGAGAFEGCERLQWVNLDSIEHIGDNAFKDCTALKRFVAYSVATFGENVFEGCTALDSVSVPYGTTLNGTGPNPFVMKTYSYGAYVSASWSSDHSSMTAFIHPLAETPYTAIFINDELRVIEKRPYIFSTDIFFIIDNFFLYNFELYIEVRPMYQLEILDNGTGDNVEFSYVAKGTVLGGDVVLSGVVSESVFIPEGFDVTVQLLPSGPVHFDIDADNTEYYGSDPNAYSITGSAVAIDAIDGDISFYADAAEYTITYHNVKGTNVNTLTYTAKGDNGADIELLAPADIPAGYEWAGWLDENSAAVTKIEAGTMGNRTFTASYDLATYSITYLRSGGDLDGNAETSNATSYDVESAVIFANPGSVEGYRFTGWYEDSSRTYGLVPGSTGNRTVTAVYEVDGAAEPQIVYKQSYAYVAVIIAILSVILLSAYVLLHKEK